MEVVVKAPCRVSFAGGGSDLLRYSKKHGGCVVGMAIQKYVYTTGNFGEIYIYSNGARESGIGGSGAMLVSRIKYENRDMDRTHVMMKAIEEENLGQQDQIFAAKGGLMKINFGTDRGIECHTLPIKDARWLCGHLSLVYIGKRVVAGHTILKEMSTDYLAEQKELAEECYKAIQHRNIFRFAEVVNKGYELKVKSSPHVTSKYVSDVQSVVEHLGAIGFKVCGAGSGGYALIVYNGVCPIGEKLLPHYSGVTLFNRPNLCYDE